MKLEKLLSDLSYISITNKISNKHSFHFALQDSLLMAISEEYVEGVEVLLTHEEHIHKSGEAYVCIPVLSMYLKCVHVPLHYL